MIDENKIKLMWINARNRWYSLSIALSDNNNIVSVLDIAIDAGFESDSGLRNYFKRWGDKMVAKYGKLPYREMKSKKYEKYMEKYED